MSMLPVNVYQIRFPFGSSGFLDIQWYPWYRRLAILSTRLFEMSLFVLTLIWFPMHSLGASGMQFYWISLIPFYLQWYPWHPVILFLVSTDYNDFYQFLVGRLWGSMIANDIFDLPWFQWISRVSRDANDIIVNRKESTGFNGIVYHLLPRMHRK